MKTKFGLLLLLFAAVFFSEACEREPGDYRILSRFYGTYECMKIKYHDSTNVIVDVLPIDGDSLVYFREHAKYDFNDVSQLVLVFKAKIDIDGSFVGTTRW